MGHRSLAGLRAYERTTTVQERSVSRTINDPGSSFMDYSTDKVPRVDCSLITGKSTNQSPPITGTLNNCVFNINFINLNDWFCILIVEITI